MVHVRFSPFQIILTFLYFLSFPHEIQGGEDGCPARCYEIQPGRGVRAQAFHGDVYKNFAKKYMEIHLKYMFFKVFPFFRFRFCFSLGGSTLFTKIDEVRQP